MHHTQNGVQCYGNSLRMLVTQDALMFVLHHCGGVLLYEHLAEDNTLEMWRCGLSATPYSSGLAAQWFSSIVYESNFDVEHEGSCPAHIINENQSVLTRLRAHL